MEENRTRRKPARLMLIFRPINVCLFFGLDSFFLMLTRYLTAGMNIERRGMLREVVSTVHPDDINEKFNFLGSRYCSRKKFLPRAFPIKELKFVRSINL